MAKSPLFINKAFEEKTSPPMGFHLVPQANSFQAIFPTKPLEEQERCKIRQILEQGVLSDSVEEGVEKRVEEQLYQITEEIRAISRQGAVLLGERVFRVRELLKPYRDGTFTKWLEATFSSRKTGYNFLAYYELYIHLPREELKEKFKKDGALYAEYSLESGEPSSNIESTSIYSYLLQAASITDDNELVTLCIDKIKKLIIINTLL